MPIKERIWIYNQMCKEHILRMILTFLRSSSHFLNHPDTVHTIWILLRSHGHFKDHIWTLFRWSGQFQIFWTFFRSSRHSSYHPDTFQIIWTLLRTSGHFSDHPDTFQIIQTLLKGHPDTFQIIWTLFRLSGHYVDHLGTFQIIWIWTLWIFSGWTKLLLSISDIQQAIQQKVAGIAKTLRSALLMHWQVFSDSANKPLLPIFGPNGNLGAKSAVSCFWANNQYINILGSSFKITLSSKVLLEDLWPMTKIPSIPSFHPIPTNM